MTSLRAALALAIGGLLAACSTQGTGINSSSWNCITLAGELHFEGYGDTREQAFESAMSQCKLNAADSMTCQGDPGKCLPPKGQN